MKSLNSRACVRVQDIPKIIKTTIDNTSNPHEGINLFSVLVVATKNQGANPTIPVYYLIEFHGYE